MATFAVVGCGYWGPNLVRNLVGLPGSRVKTVCDSSVERLTHMSQLYPNVQTTRDFEQVVGDKEIDAVVIAVPVSLHFEMARRCLEAGKHTFIEKPMARSSEECKALIELAEQRDLTLMVGHTFVYSTPVLKMKEIIQSGELGQIQYINTRRLNLGLFQKDINVAWDLAPHDISTLLFILGEKPVSVGCQGKAHINPGIEDVTDITLDFAGGAFASIQSSWLNPNKIRETVVVGTEKMLVYDDMEASEKLKIYDKRVQVPPHFDTLGEFQYSYHYGNVYSPYLKLVEPLSCECRHFLDCILNGTTPDSSGYDGLDVVQVLEAADQSMRNGGGLVEIENLVGEGVWSA